MNPEPDIVADVHLYPSEKGGRQGPTRPDIFGCQLEFEGNRYDCRLLLQSIGVLEPGMIVRAPIAFLRPDLIKPRLKVGSHFTLWELRKIGEGTVEQVQAD